MDPFTQRMLEKAEQRSRALGICSADASKFPLGEVNFSSSTPTSALSTGNGSGACATTMAVASQQQLPLHTTVNNSSGGNANKLQVVEKSKMGTSGADFQLDGATSPRKVLRQFSAVDKENMDLGIEINILTDKHVEVQVQVEEQEIADEDEKHQIQQATTPTEGTQQQITAQPMAKIRDTSRNRLQRLGALYSDRDDLSSPIHRTECNFNAEGKGEAELQAQSRKPKQRLGKLAALANTINQWEDDISHHNPHSVTATAQSATTEISISGPNVPPPKPDLPSRGRIRVERHIPIEAPKPSTPCAKVENETTKQLKWDAKVLDSLEAQGFQRRESSTVKVSYDFKKDEEEQQEIPLHTDNNKEEKRTVGKLNVSKFAAVNATNEDKKDSQPEKKAPAIKSGLVSGRAAIFESQAQASQQQQKPQKDPTELSLKERMKLFEKNKGEALVPKAAFGMAPSISKILQDSHTKKEENTKAPSASAGHIPVVKSDNKLRDKVAAIFSSKNENKIKEDIRKQREEDMQLLANRFKTQKEIFNRHPQQEQKSSKNDELSSLSQQLPVKAAAESFSNTAMATSFSSRSRAPPPPPPPPAILSQNVTIKRRSPGNEIDDEIKRARTKRLYPALSDLESNESYSDNENNFCTTATVSALSTADEMKIAATQPLRPLPNANIEQDNENEDSYMESETEDSSAGICNGSLGRQVLQVVQKNEKQSTKIKEVRYAEKDQYYSDATLESSMNSESEVSMGVNDYLNEALDENLDGDDDITPEEDDENNSRISRNSKCTTASNSFSFRKATTPNKYTNCETINENTAESHQTSTTVTSPSCTSFIQPVTSELSVNKEGGNMVTLVHTVSFYRRQQNANGACSTPIRKICREQQVWRSAMDKLEAKGIDAETVPQHNSSEIEDTDEDTHSESENDNANMVQEKIKKLLDEVCKQQQIIAQTSQALNLCAATIEFSGSTESVEGERHLLVATHRRQACLDEVQRLRVEKSMRPLGSPKEKGNLTVREITVPLRQDYIRKLAADTISGHHLVCLLKYNEHVLATRTVPTLPGLLAVKFPDVLQLNNVLADFKVTLEIYGMTAQREVLPHEVKYHINLNKKSGVKTPKKKTGDNCLVMPPVQSPAGPHVVRTPALVQYGFAIFSLREIQRTTWTLTQVLGVSPLDGTVHMKVNCELSLTVEYRGFLTMFEEISGFGAWHRRWCHLVGTMVNYWKYPDDEKKKAPIGSIDLYTCSSPKVALAPRDICARLNTILLECQRPSLDTDQESLVIVPNGRTTTLRYLLSADTKEEREEWCAFLNKALTLLRAFAPPQ